MGGLFFTKWFGGSPGGRKEGLTVAEELPERYTYNEELGVYLSSDGIILQDWKVEKIIKPNLESTFPEFTKVIVQVLDEIGLVAIDDRNAVGGFHIWPKPENESQARHQIEHSSGFVKQDAYQDESQMQEAYGEVTYLPYLHKYEEGTNIPIYAGGLSFSHVSEENDTMIGRVIQELIGVKDIHIHNVNEVTVNRGAGSLGERGKIRMSVLKRELERDPHFLEGFLVERFNKETYG